MIISPYPMKTKIKLLYVLMGFQSGRTKCLTQTWNKSKSLYTMKILNILLGLASDVKVKIKKMASSVKAKTVIYASIAMYRYLRLTPSLTKQNDITVYKENLDRNPNTALKISRMKPSLKHNLWRILLQHSQNLVQIKRGFIHSSFRYLQNVCTQRARVLMIIEPPTPTTTISGIVITQLYHKD